MAARLFGTDGVRGVANSPSLSPELALGLGRAAARFARERSGVAAPRLVIGRDTRRSGPMLEDALCAGVASAGGVALRAGVLPTPGVAVVVREQRHQLGVVLSASHNAYPDNGIKLFGADGFKLDDAEEDAVEALLREPFDAPTGAGVGESHVLEDAAEIYKDWILASFGERVHRFPLLLDCANGAASVVAPSLFERLGGQVDVMGAEPDGVNINVDCGSTHLASLARRVRLGPYELGIAFDGDADRVLCVDAEGTVVDGDQIMAILARDLRARGRLRRDTVVVTSMTNLGFHRAMDTLGIERLVTDVGDRYVLAAMREHGLALGGEQSGHVIALDRQTTGDGLVAAVMLLAALEHAGTTLAEAAGLVQRFPQKLVNVRADRTRLAGCRPVWEVVERENERLAESGSGRIVLRSSGTEPLVRVMVEHEDAAEVERLCGTIASLVEQELGIPG
jgi:phosphoglucosamine mutase